jgi:UDP-N-acetylglucosamine--N-acetylmuramyl-(pentapeptide) pyrophosphoryl-undecaprenol N-acetylglucosamine transferase
VTAAGPRRVALAGGGTAGHVFPLLAVAAAYRVLRPDILLLFLGAEGGDECRLAAQAGLECVALPAAPLFGVGPLGQLRAAWRVLRAQRAARALLAARQIELVIGSGGYVSAAPLLAARRLGLATAIIEPNVAPGLTNRMLGKLVDRVYLGSSAAAAHFAAARRRVTGVPMRPGLTPRPAARPPGPPRVLVTGGSGGSGFLNRAVPALLAALRARVGALAIRHQSGSSDAEAVAAAYAALGLAAQVEPFIDDMAAAYAWADAAVAAAGAVTLAELAAVGLPALVVPLSTASEDHQTANARTFAAAGLGRWCAESDWDRDALVDWLASALHRSPRDSVADDGAAAAIVSDCEALLERDSTTTTPRHNDPQRSSL